jgi:hypothetical protein
MTKETAQKPDTLLSPGIEFYLYLFDLLQYRINTLQREKHFPFALWRLTRINRH